MNVKVEKTDKNKVKLQIEVDSQKFEEAMQKSFAKNVKKYALPGFRKGKAPRSIFERHFGEGILYEDAFNIVGADAYDEAIKENNIEAVDRPEIDIVEIGSGKNLVFTAEVTVKPEVEISKYKGIEIDKVEYNVSGEDVDAEIEKMCEKNARTISVEDRKLQKSDIANIDFEGFVDDAAFEGGKGEKYDLEIGKGAFIEGFEEQLIGMGIGDDREIKVKFPESYHSKNVAGKDATFKVKLHSIKTKELPAIDDEFAKDVSEFDTLKELKADIKSKMESKNKQKAERELEDKLLEKLIENVTVDIPQVMIERQIDNMIRDFDYRLQMQGMRLEHYLEYTNNSYQNFRLGFAESAKKAITISLAVEKVMALEKIESDEEEVKDKIAQIAAEYKKDVAEISKNLKEEDYDYFRDEIKREKTIKFLLDNAKN